MTSINTNAGAILAQKFLRSTTADMQVTQNRVSSGLRVATVTDDASSFAVAAGIRGDIKAYTAVAAALQGSTVAISVAISAGEMVAKRIGDLKAKTIQLFDTSLSTASRASYIVDARSIASEISSYLDQHAKYNGRNLIGVGGSDMTVVSAIDGSALVVRDNEIFGLDPDDFEPENHVQAEASLGILANFKRQVDGALANLGSDLNRVKAQIEFVKQTEETVRIGLGALVDADLAKESATLTALQVRQQLGVQAIGIANSAPQTLLGLFR
jgi:flagellin